MIPIAANELPALKFSPRAEKQSYNAQAHNIGWLRALSDKKDISFDVTIRDGQGNIKKQLLNCKTQTGEYGEQMNLPTMLGENLDIEVSNLKGAEELTVFLA